MEEEQNYYWDLIWKSVGHKIHFYYIVDIMIESTKQKDYNEVDSNNKYANNNHTYSLHRNTILLVSLYMDNLLGQLSFSHIALSIHHHYFQYNL